MITTIKVQQVAIVERPDPQAVLGIVKKYIGAEPLQRVGDVPGIAVDENEAGFRAKQTIPESLQRQGRTRVLPAPRARTAPALPRQLGRLGAKRAEARAV